MKHVTHRLLLAAGVLLMALPSVAQRRKDESKTPPPAAIPPAKQDTTPKPKSPFKPYKDIITAEAVTDSGAFVVHKVGAKYFYEIPDSLLGREFLLVSRFTGVQTTPGTYAGEELDENVVRWVRQENKLLLRIVTYINIADSSSTIFRAVQASNVEPIVMAFDIQAISKDSTGTVIEVTPLFTTDVPLLGLPNGVRQQYRVTSLDNTRTFITGIRSYPINVEARNTLTYRAAEPPSTSANGAITLEMNHSMVLLPRVPMKPRLADARVGFFGQTQTEYDDDAQRAETRRIIHRWRLEPKDPAAYARGELVEPIKPIVYYIDPATPEKWRKYLKQGVEDWQVAFEAAGFKNAIIAKDPPSPEEDPEWSPEDARYSVIRYFASDIQNAYGPHVFDPRSGEILESDIGWYHNVMNLLRNWFFVQTSPYNPDARKPAFDDALMGELVRFVSAHEVGHTLGYPHNMGSSVAVPVDSLRSPTYTQKYGICPSIMDYARFNYVRQPSDPAGVAYMPRVGEYDKWVTKWGYSYFAPNLSPEEEKKQLDRWVLERADNPVYHYGRQEGGLPIDPRNQTEALGDDAVKASQYGVANLKVIVNNLVNWTRTPGEDYDDLEELFLQVVGQWNRYAGHVRASVGGVYETPRTWDQNGAVYAPVPKAKQQAALKYLQDEFFTTPSWLLVSAITDKFQRPESINWLGNTQAGILNGLLDPGRLHRLSEAQTLYGADAYSLEQFFSELRQGMWKEANTGAKPDGYRRSLQRAYVERLGYLLDYDPSSNPLGQLLIFFGGGTPFNPARSDVKPTVRGELETTKRALQGALTRTADVTTRNHYNDLIARIDGFLEPDGD